MIKGDQTKTKESTQKVMYVGLAPVEVKAVNPSRKDINILLGKEDGEDEKAMEYLGEDKDLVPRVRMSFWLKWLTDQVDKYFIYSFNITNKVRKNKVGDKVQVINSTLNTTWVPLKKDEAGELTDEPDMRLLPHWFSIFEDEEGNKVGDKRVRAALLGEEELCTFLRAWIGMNWKSPNAEVFVDTDKLFKEDFSELREIIGSVYDRQFVATVGVTTDQDDVTKQYQQVYGKGFLPKSILDHLAKNFKGSSDYIKKLWGKYEDEIQGEYGFRAHYVLEPIQLYDPTKDVAASEKTRATADVTKVNSKF